MTDNNIVFVNNDEKRIEIYFPFSWDTLALMREIPDASFDKPNKFWYTPATPFHADKVIEMLKDSFYIGQDVHEMSKGEKKVPKFPMDKRLYDYQKKGVFFIVKTGGRCIIADAMGCVDGGAEIILNRGGKGFRTTIEELYECFHVYPGRWDSTIDTYTRSVGENNGELRLNRIVDVIDKGEKDVFRLITIGGKSLHLTCDHEVYTPNGWVRTDRLKPGDKIYVNGRLKCLRCGSSDSVSTYKYAKYRGYCKDCIYKYLRDNKQQERGTIDNDGYVRISNLWNHPNCTALGYIVQHRLVVEAYINGVSYDAWVSIIKSPDTDWDEWVVLDDDVIVHHKDGNKANNSFNNLEVMTSNEHMRLHADPNRLTEFMEVREDEVSVVVPYSGKRRVFDLVMEDPHHSFVANGIVVHNCGKTPQALAYVNLHKNKTLVVSPANVVWKWYDEVGKWTKGLTVGVVSTSKEELPDTDVHIMSYDIMKRRAKELGKIPYDTVIWDECFVKGTNVSTMFGFAPIEKIKVGDYVASYNSSDNVVEYKRVLAVNKRPAPPTLVRTCGNVSTAEHPYYTESGYVQAKDLQGKEVRVLRNYIFSSFYMEENKKVLQSDMLRSLEGRKLSSSIEDRQELREENIEVKKGKEKTRRIQTDEKEQPHVDAWGERENDREHEGENFLISWGKRYTHSSTIEDEASSWMGRGELGISDRDTADRIEGSWIRESSNGLQGRLGFTFFSVGDRDRWTDSQTKEVEVLRQEKDQDTELFRVDSIEILERGSGRGYREVCPDGYVYNLEVEGNNNYFANGVLVHNCHYLKNYRTQRVRAARRLVGNIPHALYLSGTPFMNRPAELFTTLNMLDPLSFPAFTKFASRYLGAAWIDGGWVFPNILNNEEELRERLSRLMIRRTKLEVLPDLPEKTRVIVPVDIPMAEYNKAKRNLSKWYEEQGKKLNGQNVLAKMAALRQIVGREKVRHVVSLAEDILQDEEQVVIFSHHKEVVEELRLALSSYRVGMIVGSTKPKARQEISRAFLEGDVDVVIMSVAGAEGIDLYSASHIIFCEREWVPAKEEQAEDRLHRIGQKNAVTCWYVAAKGTIDEKFAKLVEEKREVFGRVVSQDEIVTAVQDYLMEV